MCKGRSRKSKKHTEARLTAADALLNEFFLGDMVGTLLPIGIIILLKYAFGTLDESIWLLSEWAFAAIIISSLALTRTLEVKVIHQKDTSWTSVFLSRFCLLLVILSVVCLALYIVREQGVNVDEQVIKRFQTGLLVAGTLLLYIAHRAREDWMFGRRTFPEKISAIYFHRYSFDNIKEARDNIRATCRAFSKDYGFTSEIWNDNDISEYRKEDLEHLVEDLQHDLTLLQQRMKAWNKPPYVNSIGSASPNTLEAEG